MARVHLRRPKTSLDALLYHSRVAAAAPPRRTPGRLGLPGGRAARAGGTRQPRPLPSREWVHDAQVDVPAVEEVSLHRSGGQRRRGVRRVVAPPVARPWWLRRRQGSGSAVTGGGESRQRTGAGSRPEQIHLEPPAMSLWDPALPRYVRLESDRTLLLRLLVPRPLSGLSRSPARPGPSAHPDHRAPPHRPPHRNARTPTPCRTRTRGRPKKRNPPKRVRGSRLSTHPDRQGVMKVPKRIRLKNFASWGTRAGAVIKIPT